MSTNKAVVNASPFILLSKSGLLRLLPVLFDEVVMPLAVAIEIKRGEDSASDELLTARQTWLSVVKVSASSEVVAWNLGDGETEVLSFALAEEDYVALIDDRAARRCAETLQIGLMGTSGLLVLMKRRGLISSVSEELNHLHKLGLYLSEQLRNAILSEAGE